MKRERSPERRKIDPPGKTAQLLRDLSKSVAPAARRLGLRVYLVGGAVRDLMEGRDFSGEWDLVVFSGDGNGAAAAARELACSWGVRDPVVFPRFGTYLVLGEGFKAEVAEASLRTSLKPLSGNPLVDDALSRDFTLNALYIDLAVSEHSEAVEVIDPGGMGLTDLEEGLLRTPLPARLTLSDDPLRILRAARLRSTISYRISPAVGRAARDLAGKLQDIAPERILDEMNRILLSPKPSLGLDPLGRWGAFTCVLPEINGIVGFRQDTPFHFPDLFRHSLRVVDRCRDDLALRWAALFHDCGKPVVRIASQDGDTYYGHEAAGAELAGRALSRLKAGRRFRQEVQDLVAFHMVHYSDQWSDRAVRRLRRRTGTHLDKLLELVEADSASLRLRKDKLTALANLKERLTGLGCDRPSPESPLSGRRIMEILGVPPGPWVGEAKKSLVDALEDGVITPEESEAEGFLVRWWKEAGNRFS